MPSPRRRFVGAAGSLLLVAALTVVTSFLSVDSANADPAGPVAEPAGFVTSDVLPTAQIDGVAWTQVIAGDTVFVGGSFTTAREAGANQSTAVPRSNLMAYSLSTGTLLPFAPVMNAQVRSLAVSPDGSVLYVGGMFTQVGSIFRYRIAAFSTATGALLTSFKPQVDYIVYSMVATSTAVYAGGGFTSANGSVRNRLAAFSASNGALLGWAPSVDAAVQALAISSDGTSVIAGGAFGTVNGAPAVGLASIDAATGALRTFAANNIIKNGSNHAAILSLSVSGNYVYGGGYKFGGSSIDTLEGTFKLDANTGAVQWIEDCHGDTYGVYATPTAVFQVGHSHYCGNNMGRPQPAAWNYNRATAYTANATGNLIHDSLGYANWNGQPSPSAITWFPKLEVGTFTGKGQAAWSVTGDGTYVVLGGEFLSVNGVPQQGLVRFGPRWIAPGADGPRFSGATFVPTLTSLSAGTARIAFLANWDRDDRDLTYKVTRNGLTTVVYTATVSSAEWDRPALGFTDTGLTPGVSYIYRITATDGDGNAAVGDGRSIVVASGGTPVSNYGYTVLAQGASLYWPLNEAAGSTTALDYAGSNDAAINTGTTFGTSGALGTDGSVTTSGATRGDFASSGSLTSSNVFSAAAWFKTTSIRGGRILGFSDLQVDTSAHRDRQIYMNNTGKLSFGVWGSTQQTPLSFTSAASYNDGNWHQAVATMGPNGMVLYVDGVKVGSRSDVTAGERYVGYWRAGGDTMVGYLNVGTSPFFAGSIDEVSTYPSVLTLAQVNAQYAASGRAATGPSDSYGSTVYNEDPTLYWRLGETAGTVAADAASGAANPGTYNGTSTKGVAGAVTGTANTAVTFNGSTGFVASNNSYPNPTVYSVEAWVKTTSTSGGRIIGFGTAKTGLSASTDRQLFMQNDGKVVFGTNTASTIVSPTALNNNQWHHLVGTQGPGGMTLYVDGIAVGTNAQTAPSSYSGYWRVGGDRTAGTTSNYLIGTIDEAAVYPSVLTAARVSAHFTAGGGTFVNVPPTASFTAAQANLLASVDATASSDPDGSIAGYAWNFGDGATATGVTASHSYSAAGTYVISLVVTDNRGGSGSTTQTVNAVVPANQPPTAAFTSTINRLAVGVDATTSTDSDGTIAGYAWDFGDGSTATGVTASHSYSTPGTYVISLVVTDNQGGSGSTTQTVNAVVPANQPPTAAFTSTINRLAVGVDATTSTDSDGTIAGYAWDFGDGSTATGVTASHTYLVQGSYVITLTVTDDQSATGTTTQSINVAPNNPPTPVVSTSTNGFVVTANGTASTDTDGIISSYTWDFGDSTGTTTGANATHTYAVAGTYQVMLTVVDNDGASVSTTNQVVISGLATYAADQFTRTVAAGWGAAETGGSWTVTSGATAAGVSGGYGKLPVAKGGSRTANLASVSAADVDLRVTLNVNSPVTGGATQVSSVVRKTAGGEYRMMAYLTITGTVSVYVMKVAGGVTTTLKSQSIGLSYTPGTDLNVRFLVSGSTTVALSAKAWTAGGAEPAAFQVTTTDAAPPVALQGAGAIALMTVIAATSTATPVTVSFKGLSVQAPGA